MQNHAATSIAITVQGFTTFDALTSFGVDMLDLSVCRNWVLHQIRPIGAACHKCGTPIESQRSIESFMADGRTCCKQCGKWFSNRSGTILQDSKLGWRELYLLAVLTELGMKQEEIGQRVGVHPDTVANWQGTFKTIAEVAGEQ